MSEPRRHHYVPQTYLKNFCIPGEKSGKIYVYDKVNHKIYKSDIGDIAVERDFYKVTDREDIYYWEHFYSKEFESKYPKIISNLNAACTLSINNATILNASLIEEISYMMCAQLLRTKKARTNQFRIGKKVASEKLDQLRISLLDYMNPEQKAWLDNFELTDDLIKELELPIINDKERLAKFIRYLTDRCWVIYYNNISSKIPYKTSDHPVCYFNVVSKSTSFEDNGLAVQSTVIFFPINNRILIALYPKGLYFGSLKKLDGQMIVVDEEKFINQINDIQMMQCYRQVYSSQE